MENTNVISKNKISKLVAETYVHDKDLILYYVFRRINNYDDALDITQDVFLRMMEYGKTLCEETVRSFMFTVARNLIIDYLRHFQKKQEVDIYMLENTSEYDDSADVKIIHDDLENLERMKVLSLPEQRKVIYMKNRYEEKTSKEISKELCLSKRTVEGHLLLARKQVREYIKQCI